MSQLSSEEFARFVARTAVTLPYPPTPDISTAVARRPVAPAARHKPLRRRALAAALLLALLLSAALAIPPVRAALFEFLYIGALRIGLLPEGEAAAPPDLHALSIVDVGQEVTPAAAAEIIPLPAPGYPPALGPPASAYAQNLLAREPVVTYLWPATAVRPQLTLTLIALPGFALKWAAGEQVTMTEVAGREAVWIEGPHRLDLVEGQGSTTVTATNVLIWSAGDLTYRLEGNVPLAEARRIAESWP